MDDEFCKCESENGLDINIDHKFNVICDKCRKKINYDIKLQSGIPGVVCPCGSKCDVSIDAEYFNVFWNATCSKCNKKFIVTRNY